MSQNQIIDAWLKTATQDLCDAAKKRIALEIKAHFNDAVAAHLAQGLSVTEAQIAAWNELGSAEAASKRFSKEHLTKKEAVRLREAIPKRFEIPWLAIFALFVCALGLIIMPLEKNSDFKALIVYMCLVSTTTSLSPLATILLKTPHGKLQLCISFSLLGYLLTLIPLFYLHGRIFDFLFALMPIGAAIDAKRWLVTWRKAKNDHFIWA